MKTYRKQMGITIKQACEGAKVPMRTYIRYENDPDYGDELKRKAMLDAIYMGALRRMEGDSYERLQEVSDNLKVNKIADRQ